MRRLLIFFVVLWMCPAAMAQTRATVDLGIGSESGLGYHFPYTAIGGTIEQSMRRFEFQSNGKFSPTHKYLTSDGHQFSLYERDLFWVTHRVALYGADGESWLSTSQFSKHANFPEAGFAAKVYFLGSASRIYFGYLFPTGARPTDGSLQSNRTQGVSFTLESLLWSRVRLDTTFDVLGFLSQSGAGVSPRTWTGTVVLTFRIGSKLDTNSLY